MIEISLFLFWACLFVMAMLGFFIASLFQIRERKKDEIYFNDKVMLYKDKAEKAERDRDMALESIRGLQGGRP